MTGTSLHEIVPVLQVAIGPVILISGYLEEVSKDTLMKSGVRLFLRKPFTQDVLARHLREILDGHPIKS